MSKEIPLTKGKIAIVDDELFDELSKYSWQTSNGFGKTWYASRTTLVKEGRKFMAMHRQILGLTPQDKVWVDHKNLNGLDNRRENLREATMRQNQQNRGGVAGKSSQYKGVSRVKSNGQWLAQITGKERHYNLGRHDNEEDAARAYDTAAREMHGEFAWTNFPLGDD